MSKDKTERMEYFISLLDDYIDGKLGKGQAVEIEQALNEDTFLTEVLKQHVQARGNMRIAGEEELRKKFSDSFEPIPVKVEPKPNLLIILVAIILLLGLVWAAYFYSSEQKEPEQQTPLTASVTEQDGRMLLASVEDPSYDFLRSDKDTIIAERWLAAVDLFIAKHYKEVDGVLSTLEKDSNFVKAHFGKFLLMKGVANLKMEKYDVANHALSKISEGNPYYDQAEWYLALSYFYAEESVKAKQQLEKIVFKDSHYKLVEARKHLKLLNSN